jgi:hypothetical protein
MSHYLFVFLILFNFISSVKEAEASSFVSEAGSTAVFGLLENNKGYRFVSFSFGFDGEIRDDGLWVDLDSLEPAFITDDKECSQGIVEIVGIADVDELCDKDGVYFRTVVFDVGDLAKNTIGNVATQFAGIGMSGYYTTRFDQAAYGLAIREAVVDFDVNKFLGAVIHAKNDYKNEIEKISREVESAPQTLAKLIKLDVEDRSGLFDLNDISIQKMVDIDVEGGIGYLEPEVFSSVHELMLFWNKTNIRKFNQVVIRLSCRDLKGFSYTVDGCNNLLKLSDFSGQEEIDVFIKYRISSKDSVVFMPSIPQFNDEHVIVRLNDDGSVVVDNISSGVVHIESMSLSINGDISTKFLMGVDLAEGGSRVVTNILEFESFEDCMERSFINAEDMDEMVKTEMFITYFIPELGEKMTIQSAVESPYRALKRLKQG